jgi:hypothetical protein
LSSTPRAAVADSAQNREKPYTVTIEDGESIELRLRVNSDFWVSPPADGSSRAGLRVDEDGIPTNRVEFRYYDLFYLTANHGALGMLTGPGEWTFAASVDEETDILCVTATCQHKGWTVRKETVLVPLSIEVGKYLFLNVDLDKLEAMAPGARAEQSDHIRGGADRRRAELLREERKAQSRAGSEGPDRAPGTPARTSRELSRDQAGKQASKSQGQIRRGGLESSIHCRVVWGAEKGEIQAVDSGDDKWHVSVLTKSLEKSGNARQK